MWVWMFFCLFVLFNFSLGPSIRYKSDLCPLILVLSDKCLGIYLYHRVDTIDLAGPNVLCSCMFSIFINVYRSNLLDLSCTLKQPCHLHLLDIVVRLSEPYLSHAVCCRTCAMGLSCYFMLCFTWFFQLGDTQFIRDNFMLLLNNKWGLQVNWCCHCVKVHILQQYFGYYFLKINMLACSLSFIRIYL